MIAFFVEGIPVAQPRPRVVHAGRHVRAVSNPKGSTIATWKAVVRLTARMEVMRQPPLTGPLWLYLLFLMPRRLKDRREGRPWHFCRPDCDNLWKALADALTGICYEDDAQICYCEVAKRVAAAGEKPGVSVRVVPAEEG